MITEKAVVFGPAFLAGALVFWERHVLHKAVVFGSAFLAGAFVSWVKHELKSLQPSALATHMPMMQNSWTRSASHSK